MPTLKPDELRRLVHDLFAAIGMPDADPAWTAGLLVRANLQGHDSHGVIRVPQYLAEWRAGKLDPAATPVVVTETPATALLDGRGCFGQAVTREAMALAIRKGPTSGSQRWACDGPGRSVVSPITRRWRPPPTWSGSSSSTRAGPGSGWRPGAGARRD